jgi:hypothetical protein
VKEKPSEFWTTRKALRADLEKRWERLAQLTLPYLYTPQGTNPDRDGAARDFQSLGATSVNHLSTRLMLTLFNPAKPFMRLDPTLEMLAEAAEAGLPEEDLKAALVEGEMAAVKRMDQKALRPKLFEILKHLIVLGNTMMVMDEEDEDLRAISVKHYVVQRSISGKVVRATICEEVLYEELEDDVRALEDIVALRKNDGDKVKFYIDIVRSGKEFTVSQWVEDTKLDMDKTYSEQDCPYRILCWNLPDEADYGIGLAGEVEGDLEALSDLSRAMIEGALLASEYRWLVNPGGYTKPEDFEKSENGAAIPGLEGDITLLQAAAEVASAIGVQEKIALGYINRLGRTFLLGSAVTRDAERVTAEEIRLLAAEQESGLGGAYSRLAVDLQFPLGLWLLKLVKIVVNEREVTPSVVTGLDALSRNGEVEALGRFLDKIVKVAALPEAVLEWLELDVIFTDIGNGEGVKAQKYVKKAEAVLAARRQRQASEVAQATATAAGEAAAQQGTQPQ